MGRERAVVYSKSVRPSVVCNNKIWIWIRQQQEPQRRARGGVTTHSPYYNLTRPSSSSSSSCTKERESLWWRVKKEEEGPSSAIDHFPFSVGIVRCCRLDSNRPRGGRRNQNDPGESSSFQGSWLEKFGTHSAEAQLSPSSSRQVYRDEKIFPIQRIQEKKKGAVPPSTL